MRRQGSFHAGTDVRIMFKKTLIQKLREDDSLDPNSPDVISMIAEEV